VKKQLLLAVLATISYNAQAMNSIIEQMKKIAQQMDSTAEKIKKAADECNAKEDFFENKCEINGKPATVISFFDFSIQQSLLTATFTPNRNNNVDMRPLELALCLKAQQAQAWNKQYRGTLGLLGGFFSGAGAAYVMLKIFKRGK
jgi:hypothetical protein